MPADLLLPGGQEPAVTAAGSWELVNHPRKNPTRVPNAQHLVLEAPVSKSAAGTAFLVGCFGIAGARQSLEAKQTLFRCWEHTHKSSRE